MTEYEKTFIPDMYAKGIRMDVYADDGKNGGEGTLYNVEMQQRDEYNISKRSRYYQSAMDIDALARGVDYSELKNTYIIFICLFDPFGKGRQRYTFTKICEEENEIRLDDGSAVLVLTDRPGEPEINEFYRYLKNSTDEEAESSGSTFIKQLNRQVQKVRYDRKTEVEYLNFERLQKEQYNIGRKDGYLEGEKRGEKKGEQKKEKFLAQRMKAKGMHDDELAWSRALGEFSATLMLVGATRMKTETLPTSIYLNMATGDTGPAMACAMILLFGSFLRAVLGLRII